MMSIFEFEFKWIHVIGPLLAIIAMLALGRNMVNKSQGRRIHPWSAVLLIGGAMGFHFLFGEGTLLDRVTLLMADFGIAMILDSGYLIFKKVDSKPFWVLGILTLVAAIIIYVAATLGSFAWNGMKNGFAQELDGQVLLELGPDDSIDELAGILEKYDAKYEKAFPMVDMSEDEDLAQFFLIELEKDRSEEFIKEVAKDKENVDHVAPNYEMELVRPIPANETKPRDLNFTANDPMLSRQWWMEPESTNKLHDLLKNNKPRKKATVAIIDTGVDENHEDLKSVFKSSPGGTDPRGHGTHCAGLAGASTNNGTGIASYNWEGEFVEIASYKALGKDGSGSVETIAEAIIKAAEADSDVLSLSLGGPHRIAPRAMKKAVEYALSRGCIVIVAAGNSNADAKFYSPANIDGVIVVAALDKDNSKAGFSNTNSSLKMPIAAPGVDMVSSIPKGKYAQYSGTSMATPIVAGILGIMRSFDPDLSAQEAWKILNDTGIEIESTKKTGKKVNPEKAIRKVME